MTGYLVVAAVLLLFAAIYRLRRKNREFADRFHRLRGKPPHISERTWGTSSPAPTPMGPRPEREQPAESGPQLVT